MSAPLRLTPDRLRDVAVVLEELTTIRKTHDVDLDPYGQAQLGVGDNTLRIAWDDEADQYVVQDRIGD